MLRFIVRIPSPPPPPFIKGGGGFEFFKIDGNGGGLKIFARKGGLGKMGGVCLEMWGCHIILRFLWRFLIMQHRKKNIDVFIFPL